ncbi:proton-conducting transporter membrane subunit [uncultured Sphaerochaeta sp.]|uniref:complex I subunit 5 family protein n=1 Tax=uncultured Sphaerochaeta sp. TaxID=886478 RepID=UPI002A0A24D3|nr:proton-conducting transporter membrane subunit [uncultured Sphaerochaeta sp.]
MNLDQWVFMPLILPLLGASLAFCSKAFLKGKPAILAEYLAAFVGIGIPFLTLAVLFAPIANGGTIQGVVGSWKSGIAISYRFDGFSWLLDILSLTLALASWIYSRASAMKKGPFTAILLIQLAALAATMMTYDLFNLFVCLEVLGVTSYVMIAISEKNGSALASFSYLMVSATAMVFFLLGTYGLYTLTGNLSYEGIAANLQNLGTAESLTYSVSLTFIVLAIALRVAIMPLSGWLSDAHSMAPHAVSAMLSGVLLKTPLFALAKLISLLPKGQEVGLLFAYAGSLSALFGVIAALCQKDAKRLLAYHSISQIGYVVTAWGMALYAGLETKEGKLLMVGALLYALYHGLFKALLFLGVGTATDYAGSRDVYAVRNANKSLRLGGERLPLTLIAFCIGAFSIAAIPPFNGFFSKALLTYSVKGTFHYYLLTLAGAGTVASFIKLSRIFWPRKKQPGITAIAVKETGKPHFPLSIHVSLLFLSLLCILTGMYAQSIYNMFANLLGVAGKSFAFYSEANLFKTLYTVLSGIILFFLVSSRIGSKVLGSLRKLPHYFQDHFFAFILASTVLGSYLYFV